MTQEASKYPIGSGAARMKNGQAAPRLVPVRKQTEPARKENAYSQGFDLKERNMFRNSFFNNYQDRMLVQKIMKAKAMHAPLSPASKHEEPLSRTYDSSKGQSKGGSSEDLATDAAVGAVASGTLDDIGRDAGIFTEPNTTARRTR